MYKVEVCKGMIELNSFIAEANENCWKIVSVTEVNNPIEVFSTSKFTIIYEERDYEEEFWG